MILIMIRDEDMYVVNAVIEIFKSEKVYLAF